MYESLVQLGACGCGKDPNSSSRCCPGAANSATKGSIGIGRTDASSSSGDPEHRGGGMKDLHELQTARPDSAQDAPLDMISDDGNSAVLKKSAGTVQDPHDCLLPEHSEGFRFQ